MRCALQTLESLPPSTPATLVQQAIQNEFPNLERQGVKLARHSLAEASVAVVHPFLYRDPITSRSHHGVFKILKPGIIDRMNRELDAFPHVGQRLDDLCETHHLPPIAYREVFQVVSDTLRHEIDLTHEQRHLAEAAHSHDGRPRVLIPRLFPFQSPRATSMQRINGRPLNLYLDETKTQHPPPANLDLDLDLARTLVDTFFVRPLTAPEPSTLFHADPHAGNLFVTDQNNQLALLDWSLAGRLTTADRSHLVHLTLGALTLDPALIKTALLALASRAPDLPALDHLIHHELTLLATRAQLPSFFWSLDLLDHAVQQARLQAPSRLILFRKSLLMLEGVLADLLPASSGRPAIDRLLTGLLTLVVLRDPPLPFPLRFPPLAPDTSPLTWPLLCEAFARLPTLPLRALALQNRLDFP